jgi:Sigma-70, region 4
VAAKRERASQGALPRRPTIRVRPGSAERELGLLTQKEVAAIMGVSERAVRAIERRAPGKLRNHPKLRPFWVEYTGKRLDDPKLEDRTTQRTAARRGFIIFYCLSHR